MNTFDRVLKIIAREYASQLLELALPGASLQIVGTLENVELALPEERVDFVHRVLWGEQAYILHIEFQTAHEADTPRRLFVYSALLTRQLGLPVLTVVFYLARRQTPVPAAYAVQIGGLTVNRFEYPVVKLWEHADQIAAGRWPELAPLLVMLAEEPPDRGVLARERELILQESDSRKRASLLACAVTIGARYFDKDFLWRFFREEVEMLKEATFIEEWLEEAREQAREQALEQGLQTGRQEERRATVRHILQWRFGKLPFGLDVRLDRLTGEQLLPLVDRALDAASPEEFAAALG